MDNRRENLKRVHKLKLDVSRALEAETKRLDCHGKSVFVGIRGGETTGDGLSIAGYGAVHEFGTAGMPERSFLRVPLSERKNEIYNIAHDVLKAGGTCQNALDAMGLTGVNISSDAFDKNDWAPNKSETIKRKGSEKVLVDTGQLRQAIDYVIR